MLSEGLLHDGPSVALAFEIVSKFTLGAMAAHVAVDSLAKGVLPT